jgi:hypothetical protein
MTDAVLRPIETIYKGFRFRSRLEARWAVFFDRCKQHFIYEDEGYRLPSGPYLPDFYFPSGPHFVEVKPSHLLPRRHFEFEQLGSLPIRDDLPRELVLAHELYRQLGLRPLSFVIVYGDPLDVLDIDETRTGGSIQIGRDGLRVGLGFIDSCFRLSAADAARAARFEHGERQCQ